MVSARYVLNVAEKLSLYVLLERVSNLLRSELRAAGASHELEPVHLQALDYLERANDYSNTPLGVAEYLGLTKGNVSQRLIALERGGYLRRTPDAADGRVSHLTVTTKGRSVLRGAVPPRPWREALSHLPPDTRRGLENGLLELLHQLQAARGFRSFGVCRTCRYFQPEGAGFRCGLTQELLDLEQSVKICREHEAPATASG